MIATTNRDLDAWVARKRFRADLFYRLNVLPIEVPPLRDRPEDIVELADHFLDQAVRQEGARALTIAPAAERLLTGYAWPGNVRELENLCRRVVTLCTGDTMAANLIEPWLQPSAPPVESLAPLREGRMLEDMERQLIERMLTKFNGHRAKSAKALGMGVRTLTMKLKQWREQADAEARELETVGA